jgi:hypothetical protein
MVAGSRLTQTAPHIAGEWEQCPAPASAAPEPADIQDKKLFFEKFDLMLAMAQLALESDSTRIVTLMVDAFATPVFRLHPDQDTTDGYQNLSHHGQAAAKLRQQMALYSSNMGDSNTHDNTNLPILLAGGGFKHGQHIAFRRDNNAPLSNLFVTMLQRMGVETESFASSTGPIDTLPMDGTSA